MVLLVVVQCTCSLLAAQSLPVHLLDVIHYVTQDTLGWSLASVLGILHDIFHQLYPGASVLPGIEQVVMSPIIANPYGVVMDIEGSIGGFSPLVKVSGTNDLVLVCLRVTEVPDFLLQVLDPVLDAVVVGKCQGNESKTLEVDLSSLGDMVSQFLRA